MTFFGKLRSEDLFHTIITPRGKIRLVDTVPEIFHNFSSFRNTSCTFPAFSFTLILGFNRDGIYTEPFLGGLIKMPDEIVFNCLPKSGCILEYTLAK